MRYLGFRSILPVFLLIFTFSGLLFPQENRPGGNEFYSGSAEGKDISSARAAAMDNLIQQIQVFVSSSNVRTLTENSSSLKDSVNFQTVTRSSIMLKDVEETITPLNDGRVRVVRFVSKKTVRDLFERRKFAIREYLRMAEDELNKNSASVDLGFVLKNYYRAYLLSLITQDTLLFTFRFDPDKPAYSTTNIIPAIQAAMKFVVSNISLTPRKKLEAENLTWIYRADYRNKTIKELKFSYFDGVGEMMGNVNKGEAVLEFYFRDLFRERSIVLAADIAYEDEMDDELQQAQGFFEEKLGKWEFSTVIPAVLKDQGQGTRDGGLEKRDAGISEEEKRGKGEKGLETRDGRLETERLGDGGTGRRGETNMKPEGINEKPKVINGKPEEVNGKPEEINGKPEVIKIKPGEVKDVVLVNMNEEPEVVGELIKSKDSIKDLLNVLNRYEKNSRIITGSRQDFESSKDLYAIVLNDKSAAAIIKCRNEAYIDLMTQRNVLLKDFAGKRIKWFEAVR